MITAKEVNEAACAVLREKYKDLFDKIEKEILTAMNKGEFYCTINMDDYPLSCTQITQVLADEDFKCNTWATCDGYFITINWERD
jgi:hypothetical protein